MLLKYYKLREQPFGDTPDTRYLYESHTHREALASLLYGVECGRGFIALVAEPGMGKTTLLFRTLEKLRGRAKTVFLFQAMFTPLDFMRMLLCDLGVHDASNDLFELQNRLNEILVEYSTRGECLVVMIDEAQNLDDSVLEFLRMLSNFETPQGKLMKIILSGQPQLARKLASPRLLQLKQRISIVTRLESFSAEESNRFVNHRLRVAGYKLDSPLFTTAALRLIAEHSGGIPRNISNVCFNALSLGCALKKKTIDVNVVGQVIADLDLSSLAETERPTAGPKPTQTLLAALSPKFGAWFSRAAIFCATLFALARTSVTGSPGATVMAKSGGAGTVNLVSPLSTPARASQLTLTAISPSGATRFLTQSEHLPDQVLVPAGATLNEICTKTLGICHSRELAEIYRLNPWLTDPDYLEAGRILRLPSRRELAAGARECPSLLSGKPSTEGAAK